MQRSDGITAKSTYYKGIVGSDILPIYATLLQPNAVRFLLVPPPLPFRADRQELPWYQIRRDGDRQRHAVHGLQPQPLRRDGEFSRIIPSSAVAFPLVFPPRFSKPSFILAIQLKLKLKTAFSLVSARTLRAAAAYYTSAASSTPHACCATYDPITCVLLPFLLQVMPNLYGDIASDLAAGEQRQQLEAALWLNYCLYFCELVGCLQDPPDIPTIPPSAHLSVFFFFFFLPATARLTSSLPPSTVPGFCVYLLCVCRPHWRPGPDTQRQHRRDRLRV